MAYYYDGDYYCYFHNYQPAYTTSVSLITTQNNNRLENTGD
jgi:hypothetical protein